KRLRHAHAEEAKVGFPELEGYGVGLEPRLKVDGVVPLTLGFERDRQPLGHERTSLRPPVEVGDQTGPVGSVVVEDDASMAYPDVVARALFPEVGAADLLVPEPDGAVVFVPDWVRMPHAREHRARGTEHGVEERTGPVRSEFIPHALHAIDPQARA